MDDKLTEESALNEARIEALKETIESRGNAKAVCESYIDVWPRG